MKIDLRDKTLFGNDAADDEQENIFTSYAIERPEVTDFLNRGLPVQVVRAYKGEGKSALLRLVSLKLKAENEPPLVVSLTASSISPALEGVESDKWVRAWKTALLKYAASEIGSKISLAFSDDAISLVEEAEANGFKERSFVSSLFDRLKPSTVSLERTRITPSNHEKTLQRWANKGSLVWFIIDDVDQNFENNVLHKIKISSFFIAIRQIANQIPEFRFRTAIRPNVWTIVKREYEALSHIEQYMVDLRWSKDDYYQLLSKRVEGYLHRTGQWETVRKSLGEDPRRRNKALIAAVLDDPMPWGIDYTRPPTTILHTLSRQRPRWLVELCRCAAAAAVKMGREKIGFVNIDSELETFGKRRLEDTIAEFKSQCPEISELIVSFVNQPERFTTAELITAVQNRILQAVRPTIIGVLGTPTPQEVAHFLFQIGFLTARKDDAEGNYKHITFSDNPNLLNARTNLDQGYSWEIHPAFRQALKLKNIPTKQQRARN